MANTNAQTNTEVSFVAHANNSKIKNVQPMYALKPKNRHTPMPTKTKNKDENTSSSPRKRHLSNLRVNAFIATVNTEESKKIIAAMPVFCTIISLTNANGKKYAVKGVNATNIARSAMSARNGNIQPNFTPFAWHCSRNKNPTASNTACTPLISMLTGMGKSNEEPKNNNPVQKGEKPVAQAAYKSAR